jgi:adenine-specific DNA-methyltransferase
VASVSVLFVDDPVVAPHLRLIRTVCEPGTSSRPHVTVRFFHRLSVPAEYLKTTVDHIDLLEPGSFGLADPEGPGNRTVYIRCESDDLVPLEHKPHFPTSEFHITLYDGRSREFAASLLRVVAEFDWGFRVRLPAATTLTQIDIKPRKRRKRTPPKEFSEDLKAIFHSATSEPLTWNLLVSLSDESRLDCVRKLCASLHRETQSYEPAGRSVVQVAPKQGTAPLEDHKEPDIHLTPPELAREIAEYAVNFLAKDGSAIDFGDPAVGTGAFYSALLQTVPQSRIASAIGIDISRNQVRAALRRWGHKGMEVLQADYLHMEKMPPRTLILANPPYLRHQDIPRKYKQELRERASINMGAKVSARSGLYVYFLLLSHEWLSAGGLAAWLVPSEFMQTSYGAAVRHYLTHKVQLLRVHQFDHDVPQFENAKVLPAVVVFRKTAPLATQVVTYTEGGTLSKPAYVDMIPVAELRRRSKWNFPWDRSVEAANNVRIGDLFTVRRGIATGANEFFVLERTRAKELGIPAEALRPLLPKARALNTDVVESDSEGYPAIEPQWSLLDYDRPEEEIKKKYPKLWAYLSTAQSSGLLERNLVRNRRPWYKQEHRDTPLFLCTYMGRGRNDGPPLRFIWNKSNAIATNTFLLLYPKPAVAQLLATKPKYVASLFALLQETARTTMSEKWRMHAGGLHKIEPSELLAVRLASVPAWLKGVTGNNGLLMNGTPADEGAQELWETTSKALVARRGR